MSLFTKALYDDVNTTMLRGILRLIAEHEQGFKYGDANPNFDDDQEEFSVSNATPDSGWLRFSSSGRVIFLDPEIYGGTETNPPFYVLPPNQEGWLALMDVVFPQPNACETDKNKNILGIKGIVARATESYQTLDDDPRLFLDPDCDNETPFAKIFSRESAASMEAMVYTVCRVHFLQYVLRALTAFSKITPSFTNNLDDVFFQYVAENMKEQMISESTSIGERRFAFEDGVPVARYWLLFLEQCVQLAVRLRNEGKLELNEDETAALEACQAAQNDFEFPTSEDIYAEESILKGLLLSGSAAVLAGYGIAGGVGIFLVFKTLRLKKAREKLILQRKLASISSVESAAMEILKIFLKKESDFVADYLQKELEKNEKFSETLITNLSEYFINESDFMVGSDSATDVASYDESLGLSNPLNSATVPSGGDYPNNGIFVLEKYVRLQPRGSAPDSYPDSLRSVVNLQEFYGTDFGEFFDSDSMVSDHFGDLSVSDDGTLEGDSNGVSYGIRISYMPSTDFYSDDGNTVALEEYVESLSLAQRVKIRGLYLDDQQTSDEELPQTRFLFPLVSAEIDLPDMTIEELSSINSGDYETREIDGNDYLSCLKSKLLNSDSYELMFGELIPIRRFNSIVSIYVSQAFINSIGDSEDGYNIYNAFSPSGGPAIFRNTFEDWDKEVFTKTKKRLKRLFLYQYNISDELYEDGDEETDKNNALKEMFKNIKVGWNLNLKWWKQRRRVRDVCPDDIGEL